MDHESWLGTSGPTTKALKDGDTCNVMIGWLTLPPPRGAPPEHASTSFVLSRRLRIVTLLCSCLSTIRGALSIGFFKSMEGEEVSKCLRDKDYGKFEYGCEHYKRRCKIRAPCCNQIFPCRHCHNDAANSLPDPKERHELIRKDVNQVICSICHTEQEVAQVCSSCGVSMGEYFCGVCKFFDDDTSKGQFHCNDCGICRVGGRDNFFHCQNCGACYSMSLRNKHSCIENSTKNYCPVCYEYLFDSIKVAHVMKCGHTMHMDCFDQMLERQQYRCPICSKSMLDMSSTWQMLDQEISTTEMPGDYRFEVPILCNDCNQRSKVMFHILGHKCEECGSYNTRRVSTPQDTVTIRNPVD